MREERTQGRWEGVGGGEGMQRIRTLFRFDSRRSYSASTSCSSGERGCGAVGGEETVGAGGAAEEVI